MAVVAPRADAPTKGEELAKTMIDYERFFNLIKLPSRTPMVARRAELSQAEVNEDLYFLRRVRTQHNYGALLRAQAEQLPLEQIRKTFESMQRHGVMPNLEIYTTMVVACARNKDPLAAEEYINRMKQDGLEPNIWTFTALAQSYTRSLKIKEAFQVMDRLKQSGIRPNVVIYTTLIHGCILAKDVDLAWETFDHMRQRDAIEPDAVTFSVMIYACAKKEEVERARNLMDEMPLVKEEPTEVTYNSMIYACSTRRDYYVEAFTNFERLAAAGFLPDVVSYSTLLRASSRFGDAKMAQVTFKAMNEQGFLVGGKPKETRVWNSLLAAHASSLLSSDCIARNELIATSRRILDQMKKTGQPPDIYTANTQLSIYTQAHRILSAEKFFNQAFELPASIFQHITTTSLTGDSRSSSSSSSSDAQPSPNDKQKQEILWEFKERFPPDVVSFTCLLQLYGDTLRPEKAIYSWKAMKSAGVEPNRRAYNSMIYALARAKYVNSAMKYLREMRGKNFMPHQPLIALLVNVTKDFPDLQDEVRRLTCLPLKKVDAKNMLNLRLKHIDSQIANFPFAPPRPRRPSLHHRVE